MESGNSIESDECHPELPPEIWDLVRRRLPMGDLLSLSQVSHSLHDRTEVEVHTQDELTAVLAAPNLTLIVLADNGLTVTGPPVSGAWVVAVGAIQLHVSAGSVHVSDTVQVTATDAAEVHAEGQAQVSAYGYARVYATDDAAVEAHNHAQVYARRTARVLAVGSAEVFARDDSAVTARGGVNVSAVDRAEVTAFDQAVVMAYGEGVTVSAGGAAHVYTHGSLVTASDRSRVVAEAGAMVSGRGRSVRIWFTRDVRVHAPLRTRIRLRQRHIAGLRIDQLDAWLGGGAELPDAACEVM
ncbi:F-box protein [Streptomyces vinaceus]|uniref:F-box protein n=1 Tax=Streptomyces vinaceus TaxID=1960 RepID=UPI00382D661B